MRPPGRRRTSVPARPTDPAGTRVRGVASRGTASLEPRQVGEPGREAAERRDELRGPVPGDDLVDVAAPVAGDGLEVGAVVDHRDLDLAVRGAASAGVHSRQRLGQRVGVRDAVEQHRLGAGHDVARQRRARGAQAASGDGRPAARRPRRVDVPVDAADRWVREVLTPASSLAGSPGVK